VKAHRWALSADCRWLKFVMGLPVAMALLPVSVTLVLSQQAPKPLQQEMEIAPALPAYTPKGKRDPFKSPFDKKKIEPKTEYDVPPPRNRRPPGPAGLLVNDAQLMGVVQGPTGRVAMIAGDGTLTYFLKTGDRLYDGSIIEITENSIKLVREIKISSKVVDQQEVVKKISPAP
jgi:Tfp pilus assembly protein PilP